MRRNNRGGNRNRGMGNQNSGGVRPLMGSSGPTMSNNLQLQELDLELALLKRKREMIQEQHSMLVTESRGFNRGGNQFGFDQSSQSFGQRSGPAYNFNSSGSRRGYDPPQAVKRPAIDPWDNSAPSPKRFGGPSRRRPNPVFKEQRPSRPPPSRPAPGGDRPTGRTSTRPGRVQKSRQNNTAPNKLKSYPTAERKNLVKEASNLVSQSQQIVSYVLEADKSPHPKLLGRLELALGGVIRQMREAHGAQPEHADTFVLGPRQRSLKQTIRERLRQVMMGKTVGVNAEILETYRGTFPPETDLELLNSIRESNQPTSEFAIKIVQQANAERYFKNNFTRLLSASMSEMLDRVKMLYTKEIETKKPLHEIVNNLLAELDKSIPEEDKNLSENALNGTAEVENSTSEETVKDSENASAQEEKVEAEKLDTSNTQDAETKPDENKAEESAKPEDTTQKTPTASSADAGERRLMGATRFYQRLIESYLKKTLPVILPKYKEYIIDIIGTDEAFQKTEAFLIQSTNEKAKKYAERSGPKEGGNTGETKTTPVKPAPAKTTKPETESATPRSKSDRQLYFVKVIGRPGLPRKKVMKVFLDSFEPTLIKKHRNIHNILFISFDKEENYQNILDKNGHVIDSKRLEIKPSEKINKNKPQQKPETQADDTSANAAMDSLDEQIDDLLTSIAEEDADTSVENVEGVANDDQEVNNEVQEADDNGTEAAEDNEQHDENQEEQTENQAENGESADQAENAENTESPKEAAGGKTTRASARLNTSTPTAIRTRRTSKLAQ